MRSITIRQFQQHFYTEIATLPFTVTRNGKPAFNVTTCDHVTTLQDKGNVTTSGTNVTTYKTPTSNVTTHDVTTSKVIHTQQDALKAVHSTLTELPLSKHRQSSNDLPH